MTQNYFTPIVPGASNGAATWNNPMGQLDAAIAAEAAALQDEINQLIIEAGTSDAETIAARTAINYLAGSPPDVLGDTIAHVGRNHLHVDAYGATGDGVTNDTAAINAALDAASAGDTIVFSAGKTYVANAVLTIHDSDITLLGYGATIDASDLPLTNAATVPNPLITAVSLNKISIIGLRLIGPSIDGSVTSPGDTYNTMGIFLSICNECMVRDCRIEGFFRGGIFVQSGSRNTIQGNHLYKVRYRPSGAIGGIVLSAQTKSSAIGNVITESWDCGIGSNNSSHCLIANNVIEGADWTVVAAGTSMGINCLNISHFTITGNVIHRIANEGIIVSTGGGTNTVCDYNTISNNVITNALRGINIRAVSGVVGNEHTARGNVVSGNTIVQDGTVPGGLVMGFGLYIDDTGDSVIYNHAEANLFIGNNVMAVGGGVISNGIGATGGIAHKTAIIGNVFSGCGKNIDTFGEYNLIANNLCVNAVNTGIEVSTGTNYSLITGNRITGSGGQSITLAGALTRTQVVYNLIDKKVDTSGATGSAYWIGHNTIEGQINQGVGTLSGGTATISGGQFGPTISDAVVEVWRKTSAGTPANGGILGVTAVDQGGTPSITVKSTNALDDGQFYYRIVR